MVDRIPTRSQHAAAGLLALLRLHSGSSIRPSVPFASTSYHTLSSTASSSTRPRPAQSHAQLNHTRSISSTSTASVSAHRKQAGREKARLRNARTEERVLRARQKDFPPSRSPQERRRPRDPIEEDVESSIREYMARTGPRGERLTRSQQERLLKQELRGLSTQLETLEKKAKADEATADLPELDDNVLEELYQALMLPPPPTAEESRLARLEEARREKSIEDGRGRRLLPMTRGEERKARTATDLKQRLKDARDKGRVLLPPSTAAASRGEQVAIEETIQEETGVVVDEAEMAALPYAERQEIRLQQLFARLALVHTTSDAWASSSETGTDSLQEIKSNLANRIAKILKEHDYELQTSVQQGTPNEASPAELTSNDAAALGPFPTARLDGRAPTLEPTESIDTKQAEDISSTDSSDELITRAETMVNDLSSSESRSFMLDSISKLVRSSSPSSPSSSRIPLGVASIEEWTALAVASARANDTSTLSRTLGLMQDCGYPPSLSLYNNVLDAFATQGQLEACQTWLEQMHTLGLVPDDHTYHSLVKAYATSSQYLPAITLLNTLEEAGRPASMATYTLLISRLLSTPTPSTQAVGWNAFYHMRLSAHPIPDAPLYALMIRACARGVPQPHDLGRLGVSEAERALDLFREMTTRYSVRPNAEVYNALILACARRKDFYLEAFRLLREMVELETTRSEGEGLRFAPDRWTFNVLLQGCARNRDLPRARWVLAEMVRCTAPLFEQGVREKLGREEVREMWGKRPDEESLCHVFHAYASYVPPVRRLVTVGSGSPETTEGTDSTATTGDNDPSTSSSTTPSSEIVATATAKSLELILSDPADAEEETTPGEAAQIFSALVPQTSSDLLAETRSLFARVLADQPSGHTEGPLGAVTAGVRLVNAYLAVLGAHLPVGMRGELLRSTLLPLDGQSEGLERGLFARLGATPNEHSYRVILEALREADGSTLPIVEDVWVRFQTYLGSHTAATGDTELTTTLAQDPDAGQITKCYSAYIHFHAKHASLDQAIGALRHFVSLYPPTLPTTRTASARRHARQRKDRATDAMLEGVDVDLSPLPVAKESLVGLVEMASPSTSASSGIGEDQTEKVGAMKPSPTLTFLDVELLHHRLVRFGRIKDVGFVSWVLHRYAAARRG